MLDRILKGSNLRKSRFHDHKGQLVSARSAFLHAPRSLVGAAVRVGLGKRPQLPWISYDAITTLDEFLTRDKSVLEFGSGMSTVWYARRAGSVVSIEDYRPWFDQVDRLLRTQGLTNVDYRFAPTQEDYVAAPSRGFDLIMVDGSIRDRCTEAAIHLLKPGGIFYLDNSDRAAFPDSGEARATQIALDYARDNGCTVRYFTDFAPTQFFAQEGMMVIRPAA